MLSHLVNVGPGLEITLRAADVERAHLTLRRQVVSDVFASRNVSSHVCYQNGTGSNETGKC